MCKPVAVKDISLRLGRQDKNRPSKTPSTVASNHCRHKVTEIYSQERKIIKRPTIKPASECKCSCDVATVEAFLTA